MSNATSKADRTRQLIIRATAPVFNAKGFAGTSMNDLTRATGLTKGSIYGNFDNKDAVALAAFDYNFSQMTEYMKNKILSVENAVERLLQYPLVYSNFLHIPFLKTGCPLLNTAIEADDTHPLLREKAAAALLFWKTAIENQVKRGIKRKEINNSTSPVQVAVVMMSMIEGAVMQAKLSGRSTDLRIAMDYLSQYINGLSR
ncbi:MAG TPA: TetR/AcrR family transcriptional regulator [Chitinophagaceae bacterium]|nr:TetR/AcrR family transcriptional regulator [Chitinophagaceae bacterium]